MAPALELVTAAVHAAYRPVLERLPLEAGTVPLVVPSGPFGRHVGVGDCRVQLGDTHELAHHQFYLDFQDSISANGRIKLHPSLRRQGIGDALVRAREELCSELGIKLIVVGMSEYDAFWERNGYMRAMPEERRAFGRLGAWTRPEFATYYKQL